MSDTPATKINEPEKKASNDDIQKVVFEKKLPVEVPKKSKSPFFWPQAIEWMSIALSVLILTGGGLFFIYPSFQKFQTAPQSIEKNKEKLNDELKSYQDASRIINQYSTALSNSSQELNIADRAFWKNVSTDNVQSVLNERAKLYGASMSAIKERSDLAEFFPDMQVFDIQVKGLPGTISSFVQTFETELPVIWPVSETAVSDEFHQLTIGLLKEPSKPDSEISSFNEDLYSFSKFRIMKESNIDY